MTNLDELTEGIHTLIPIIGAMGIRVTEVGDGTATVELPPGPNGNHFGALYAGSLYTAAEVLGGIIPGTVFDMQGEFAGFVPLLKSSEIRYRRPALGTVHASSAMATEDRERVRQEALETGKSEFYLDAQIVDAEGTVVVESRGLYQLRRMG